MENHVSALSWVLNWPADPYGDPTAIKQEVIHPFTYGKPLSFMSIPI